MDERARRLERLLKITAQMKRLEEWRAAQAQREAESQRQRRHHLLEALDSDAFRSLALSEVLARHLRQAAEEVARAEGREKEARRNLMARHRQKSQIERIHDRHAQIVRRLKERRELGETVDLHLRDRRRGR